jgi:pimeloyl-ACP methyl ester carboxylesterase
VVHGDADPVVHISGGVQTAEAVPAAELLVLEGVGHELPERVWETVADRVGIVTERSAGLR